MQNDTLGIDELEYTGKRVKNSYNHLSMFFHPDKVDYEQREIANKLFIRILDDFQLHQDSLLLALVRIYGEKTGMDIYNKFQDEFETIKLYISNEGLKTDEILLKFKNDIIKIVDYAYFTSYLNNCYWYDLGVESQYSLGDYNGETSVNFGLTKGLGQALIGTNFSVVGDMTEGYSMSLSNSFTFYNYIKDTKITNILRGGVIGGESLLYHINYAIGNFTFVHEVTLEDNLVFGNRVDYKIGDSSLVRLNLTSSGQGTQAYVTFLNVYNPMNRLKLVNSITMTPSIVKLNLKASYQLTNNFKFKVDSDVVQSFNHTTRQYYKIDKLYFGFKTNLRATKLSIGCVYRHFEFKHCEVGFRFNRLNIKFPILFNDSQLTGYFLVFGCVSLGVLAFVLKRKENQKELMFKAESNRKTIRDINSRITEMEYREEGGNGVEIEEAVLTLRICKEKLNNNSLEADMKVDCTPLVQQLFNKNRVVDFDKLIDEINKVSDSVLKDIFDLEDLICRIKYKKDKERDSIDLYKGQKTKLKKLKLKDLTHRLINFLLQ